MTKALQKLQMVKYARLWRAFKTAEFDNKEAQDILKAEKNHHLSVLFYDLKRLGWLTVVREKKDKRKKIYKLKEPNAATEELA